MLKTKEAPYIYDRDGIFYFTRRIPKDLQGHYRCPRIVMSLRTKSIRAAKIKSVTLSAQLDEEWLTIRWRRSDNPLRQYLSDQAHHTHEQFKGPLMSEAKEIYVSAKSNGRSVAFKQAIERAANNLIGNVGDKPIDAYTRQDANSVRDALFERGLTKASVKRQFGSIRALVNFVSREHGLPIINTFSGIYLGENSHQSESKRHPIPLDHIRSVQKQCEQLNDEGRRLISLISDSGLRLSEATGLHKDDVMLDHKQPHLILKPHPWRRLKTSSSERIVPLAGSALWAVKQSILNSDTDFLFPRYCNEDGCKSNSASAALNKWLSPRVPKGCVIHSFRHSFRDRLRAVECPQDITDRLGGWSVGSVGETYGSGYPLEVLAKWMDKAMR
jgi:integrase